MSEAAEGPQAPLFEPSRDFAFDAAGQLYLSHGDPYRIDVLDGVKGRVRSVHREFDPVPIRDEEVSKLKALVSEYFDTMTSRSPDERFDERDRLLKQLDRKHSVTRRTHLAPIGQLLVSHDGSFWVSRMDRISPAQLEYEHILGDPSQRAELKRFDLFDPQGRFLGTVDVPVRFAAMAVRGLEVTGVLRDELDVEFVVTYRVVR